MDMGLSNLATKMRGEETIARDMVAGVQVTLEWNFH